MRTLTRLCLTSAIAAAPAFAQNATLTFSDQTTAAGIDVSYVPANFTSSEYIAPGVCGDFDRDGFPDLFIPSGGNANGPDRLYMNQGDGTFQDRAAQWGLTAVHHGLGVAVGDYDGDGFLDIYEASAGAVGPAQSGHNKLYHNLAGQGFQDVAASAGVAGIAVDSFGASFGDYDLDGDLDLLVTGFNTHKNRLYRNEGNGTFTDVSIASGIFSNLGGVYGFATRFADMNGDRYPELLVSGDFGTSRYLVNNGNGTFTNFTMASGTGKDENAMGQTVGDFDRDGRVDWYVTSIHSVNMPEWTGNKLYRNLGAQQFTEIAAASGVNDGGYGWGTVAVDFDHDGWLDIAETNGAQWSSEWVGERSYLWINQGDGTFAESSQKAGFNSFGQGRGLLNFDYDRDGDEDLLLLGNNEKAQLWRNDLQGPGAHWLTVVLDTSEHPGLAPDGYGSVVRVTAGGVQQTGDVFGGDNLQSQSELVAHFGLGAATVATEVSVEWNDGQVTKLTNVAADQYLTVVFQSAWTSLGFGLAGVSGIPSLVGTGTLAAGSPGSLALTQARPSSPALLFLSFASVPLPFKGGTLATIPVTVSISLVTDPAGTLTLPWAWPPGLPAGTSLYFQCAIQDAAGPQGAALSNALKAFTP